ncbi:putative endosialidase [Synechococcus phage S-CBWM1]|uniref:Putative endosialidase n=1 Tax=Synechococcus phage S-CBWM1 TaxID=2053653 RepID=A0A3G1L3P2_9CAUD|nr:putative endosialidase [Synechococcus phage S-CBWM1]ATW62801.1 putative endosialidase [Synechococcus phage S-CBWM1]
MAQNFKLIRFIRCLFPVKRPDPSKLLDGQPAANIEATEPGLFLKNTEGELFKIGPAHVGTTAPNALANGGDGVNLKGEAWLDKSEPTGPTLRIYDGNSWLPCFPIAFARAVISETAPTVTDFLEGTMWWNNETGLTYILYGEGSEAQWIQMGSSSVR